MEKSEKVPELKMFCNTNKSENCIQTLKPEITVNQIFHASPQQDQFIPTSCSDAHYFYQSTHKSGQKLEIKSQVELMQQREPVDPGAMSARLNFHHHPPDGWYSRPAADRSHGDTRGLCCCRDCGPNQCGTPEETYR